MRIIGGNLRGKRLFSIPGKKVRPTADKLRESIFNILSLRVPDTAVLDLFSGTGALGIEALSRGARQAVFVEKSGPALRAIRRNLKACDLEKQAHVIQWDAAKNLNCLARIPLKFDLAFMDPPYNRDMVQKGLRSLQLGNCLKRGGWIVVEHSASEPIVQTAGGFAVADQRRYGKTLVTFLSGML